MKVILSCLLLVAFLTAPFLRADVIVVDASGGGSYTDIQPAIDAASEGDVILVKAGNYSSFTLDKGVMVRAFDSSGFAVADAASVVHVTDVGASSKAGISGMNIPDSWTAPTKLRVQNCAGEVVLEKNVFGIPISSEQTYLAISACANVIVTGLRQPSPPPFGGVPVPVMSIADSSVRITKLVLRGGQAGANVLFPVPGGTAMTVRNSFVVLASPDIVGGKGAHSSSGCLAFAGRGGDGVEARNSTLVILGQPGDRIRGGDGGDTDCFPDPGGAGGDGVHLDASSSAVVSRVLLEGGKAGLGAFGGDGKPFTGAVSFDDRMPVLWMTPDVQPGGVLDLTINAVEPGTVVLLAAGHGGFETVPGAVGPPLSVLPGQWFLALAVGAIVPPTDKTLHLVIPDEDVLRGLPINMQAAILGPSGGLFLTNAAARVVGG